MAIGATIGRVGAEVSQLPAHLAWMPIRRDPIRAFLKFRALPILSGVLLIVMVLGLKSWWARIARRLSG